MSDSAERSGGSNRTHLLKKHITQLATEVRALRNRDRMQRQRLAQKYGYEFLALLDSDHNSKVFVTDIAQKFVFQDEEGNIVSEPSSATFRRVKSRTCFKSRF